MLQKSESSNATNEIQTGNSKKEQSCHDLKGIDADSGVNHDEDEDLKPPAIVRTASELNELICLWMVKVRTNITQIMQRNTHTYIQ